MEQDNRMRVSYLRYSSHAQDEGYSIEGQREAIQRHADYLEVKIDKEYVDMAQTATTTRNRPQYLQMMEDVEAGLIKEIFTWKNDRLHRNNENRAGMKRTLKKHRVNIISIQDPVAEGANGELVSDINGILDEHYVRNLKANVIRGNKVKARLCEHLGGSAPIGFKVGEDKKYQIDEEKAPIVRELFKLYASGKSYDEIIREFNMKGYKTVKGNDFKKNSLHDILVNEKYRGIYIYNRRQEADWDGISNSHQDKPEDEIVRIDGGMPRIVSDEVFFKVQERVKANRKRGGAYKAKQNYLLSGLVKCGVCEGNMQGNSRKSKKGKSTYSSYRCGNRERGTSVCKCKNGEIERHRLEAFVLEQMEKYLLSESALEKITNLINEHNRKVEIDENQDLKRYKKELQSVSKKLSNLVDAIANGVAESAVAEKVKELTDLKQGIEEKIAEIQARASTTVSIEDVREASKKLKEYCQSNNNVEVKRFINRYVENVIVYQDKVEVNLIVPATEGDRAAKGTVNSSREDINDRPKLQRKHTKPTLVGDENIVNYKVS